MGTLRIRALILTALWAVPALPARAQVGPDSTSEQRSVAFNAQTRTLRTFRDLWVAVLGTTSARLSWVPYSGATTLGEYWVFRNGTKIASLPASSTSYDDVTLRDSTQYAYQVEAIGTSETIHGIPGTSLEGKTFVNKAPLLDTTNSVSITTPSLAAPASLTATLDTGDSTLVQLSWTPVANAAAYSLTRDSVFVGRFVGTSASDTPPHVGTHNYAVASIFAEPGSDGVSSPTHVTIRTGPFNILEVGDSVMWGQGLTPAAKFTTQVEDWLSAQLGRRVHAVNKSHSGALVGQDKTDGGRIPNSPPIDAEVPEDYPSVLNQALVLAPSEIEPDTVDLILMDGCANDVGIANLLNPVVSNGTITQTATDACETQMGQNLKEIAKSFSSAQIVVTGYYPIITSQSDLSAVALYAFNLGLIGGGLFLDPATLLTILATAAPVVAAQAISHSATFLSSATSALSSAVATANQANAAGRIRFVSPQFGDNNSYAAPDTWLWRVPASPTLPTQFDEVFAQRSATCASMGSAAPPHCIVASMGHPNVLGAQAYAMAIIAALPNLVAQSWQPEFATRKQAQ